jgi:hypothetical protein
MRNKDFFDLSNSESTEFTGRVLCALYNDKNKQKKSGSRTTSAELAMEYGTKDIDGKQPKPLTVEDC